MTENKNRQDAKVDLLQEILSWAPVQNSIIGKENLSKRQNWQVLCVIINGVFSRK